MGTCHGVLSDNLAPSIGRWSGSASRQCCVHAYGGWWRDHFVGSFVWNCISWATSSARFGYSISWYVPCVGHIRLHEARVLCTLGGHGASHCACWSCCVVCAQYAWCRKRPQWRGEKGLKLATFASSGRLETICWFFYNN